MTFALYDATVPSFRQALESVAGLLVKAEDFCRDPGTVPEALLQARLADDMWPFSAQVLAAAANSWGHVENLIATGGSRAYPAPAAADFVQLKSRITVAIAGLASVPASAINALSGKEVRFVVRDHEVRFTAEDFFFSFCLPNFNFHVTTAYSILRLKGLALAKRDYLGKMRMRE